MSARADGQAMLDGESAGELERLRRAVAAQADELAALAARLERAEAREREARALLVDAHAQLLRRDIDIAAAIGSAVAPHAPDIPATIRRQQELARLRQFARRWLPPGADVLVVSLGDDAMLDLNGPRAWHFPAAADGAYADFTLSDGAGAIAHLEALRRQGADYLLVPAAAADWFNSLPELRRHVEERYRLVAYRPRMGVVFALADVEGDD